MKVNFSKFIENRIGNIQSSDSFAFAAAIGLGPWLVPLGPAIIFGYALYVSAPVDMADFRTITAVAVAIGLIVAGAVSSHNAIISGGWGPWSLVIGYIFLEIVGLWLMSVGFDVKIVGTVASLLTLVVYLSRATAKEIDIDRAEEKAADKSRTEFQIEQDQLNADHERRMAEKAAELQMEQDRLNAGHKRKMEEQDAGQKHTEELARIEITRTVSEVAGKLPESSESLPEWLPAIPANLPQFRQLVRSGTVTLPKGLSGAELGRAIGKSSRTGQNWLADVRNGNGSVK